MALRPWPLQSPPLGVTWQPNRASPQWAGLAGWWPTILGGSECRLINRTWQGGDGTPLTGGATVPVSTPDPVMGLGLLTGGSPSSRMDCGSPLFAQFAATDPYSMTLWVRPTSISGHVIAYAASGGAGWYMSLGDLGAGSVMADYFNGGYHRLGSSANATAANRVTHICVTHDGSNTTAGRSLYINGRDDSNRSNGGAPSSINYSGKTLQIGARGGGVGYNGLIGDVRIYNRALSAAEVWTIYDPRTRWQLYGVPVARRGPVLSAVFRRTLSDFGARIGSRQAA